MRYRKYAHAALAATVLSIPALGQAAHTTFVPGLGADSTWWTRQNTIGRLQQQVNLLDFRTPDVYSQYAFPLDYQVAYLLNDMIAVSGQHILVGHSLGGLVVRRAYLDSPSQVAGILTVGTPHSGAIVADSAQHLRDYINSIIGAVADAVGHLANPFRANPNNFLSTALLETSNNVFARMPLNTYAAADARTNSAFVAVNLSNADYVNHVSVYGTIDKRFAWMRVTNGAINGTNNQVGAWQLVYSLSMVAFRTCQYTRRFVITNWAMARSCGRAYNAMATFDTYWQRYTARGGAFDGWIGNASSAYPGTSLTDVVNNFKVQGVDHNSLISHQDGVNAIANRMINRLGMSQP